MCTHYHTHVCSCYLVLIQEDGIVTQIAHTEVSLAVLLPSCKGPGDKRQGFMTLVPAKYLSIQVQRHLNCYIVSMWLNLLQMHMLQMYHIIASDVSPSSHMLAPGSQLGFFGVRLKPQDVVNIISSVQFSICDQFLRCIVIVLLTIHINTDGHVQVPTAPRNPWKAWSLFWLLEPWK